MSTLQTQKMSQNDISKLLEKIQNSETSFNPSSRQDTADERQTKLVEIEEDKKSPNANAVVNNHTPKARGVTTEEPIIPDVPEKGKICEPSNIYQETGPEKEKLVGNISR